MLFYVISFRVVVSDKVLQIYEPNSVFAKLFHKKLSFIAGEEPEVG